ncbi:MAG: hypothetical protein ACXADB_04050 [Candidatus Hermodarchaeia archaeon]|jgi:hypothetical protein
MPYRTNAKDDMIVELDHTEIKQACIEYVDNHHGLRPMNDSIEDVELLGGYKDNTFVKVRIQIETIDPH